MMILIHLQKPLIVSFVFTNRKFGSSEKSYEACGENLQLSFAISSRSIQNDYCDTPSIAQRENDPEWSLKGGKNGMLRNALSHGP